MHDGVLILSLHVLLPRTYVVTLSDICWKLWWCCPLFLGAERASFLLVSLVWIRVLTVSHFLFIQRVGHLIQYLQVSLLILSFHSSARSVCVISYLWRPSLSSLSLWSCISRQSCFTVSCYQVCRSLCALHWQPLRPGYLHGHIPSNGSMQTQNIFALSFVRSST